MECVLIKQNRKYELPVQITITVLMHLKLLQFKSNCSNYDAICFLVVFLFMILFLLYFIQLQEVNILFSV